MSEPALSVLPPPPVLVLAAVVVLIAARNALGGRVRIWHIMLAGAAVVLLTGRISPGDALAAVDADVMLFLLGMFFVGRAMEDSGFLANMSHRMFGGARSADRLVLLMLFGFGAMSAVLMNDTVAIIGTPLVLQVASRNRLDPKMLLLCLAFAVTIGSVMSPVGNPQNLLVAVDGGVEDPFVTFFAWLAVPTLLSLGVAYLVLRALFPDEFGKRVRLRPPGPPVDARTAALCRVSLVVIAAMVSAKVALALAAPGIDLPLVWIALAAALPIALFSPRRTRIARTLDWPTLVFFAAMFVLMRSVWDSGWLQGVMDGSDLDPSSVPVVLLVSVVVSQLTSNVPFVALYLPVMTHTGASTEGLMALAAGSTLAGNLTILGAASNVIIVQGAESRGTNLTFREFARAGAPLTALTLLVFWAWFALV